MLALATSILALLSVVPACAPQSGDTDGDGVPDGDDCGPLDPTIHPGAVEACDGLDTNCDGTVPRDEQDPDGDNSRACGADCAPEDPTRGPAAAEACNGIDDDCDGALRADEGDPDGDGVAACEGDCAPNDPTRSPSLPEVCDGVDNDCDFLVPDDEHDEDGDGRRGCQGDCDDDDPQQGLPAEVCDRADNDCDGEVDEDWDQDGDELPNALASACSGLPASSLDCDDGDPLVSADMPEIPDDGVDQDCSGADEVTCWFDEDGDGSGSVAILQVDGVCGDDGVDAPVPGDCEDDDPSIHPGAPEGCDMLDSDCDGALGPDGLGDADSDGDVTWVDCDDGSPDVGPSAPDSTCDGVDQDCNGWDLCPLEPDLQALLQWAFDAVGAVPVFQAGLDGSLDALAAQGACLDVAPPLPVCPAGYFTTAATSEAWVGPCTDACGDLDGAATRTALGCEIPDTSSGSYPLSLTDADWMPAPGDPCGVGPAWTFDGTAETSTSWNGFPHAASVTSWSETVVGEGSVDAARSPELSVGGFVIDDDRGGSAGYVSGWGWDWIHTWSLSLVLLMPEAVPPRQLTVAVVGAEWTQPWAWTQGCGPEAGGTLTLEILEPVTLNVETTVGIVWDADPSATWVGSPPPECDGMGWVQLDGTTVDQFVGAL